jgi:hypothetical protein
MHFDLVQSISLNGSAGIANDDRAGCKSTCAWVIDGATDLGLPGLLGEQGGAAWLAATADAGFSMSSADRLVDSCRQMFDHVAARFAAEKRRPVEHVWELPSAAFAAVQLNGRTMDVAWAADCVILLRSGEAVRWCTPMPNRVTESASAAALGAGIGAQALRSPAVLEDRRAHRARPGRRVLGVDAAASVAAMSSASAAVAPGDSVLLMTDGFSALVDAYAVYRAEELFAAVEARGLAALGEELRAVEAEDAACVRYPRFKRSDDATALWVRVADVG